MVSSLLRKSPIDGFPMAICLNIVILFFVWEGIYRLKLHICPQVKRSGDSQQERRRRHARLYILAISFVFSQTQFQMLQKVVPNNWFGIPGNTSNPDTSKTYSEKLLARYACFGIPRGKPIDDEQPGGKLETTRRFVLSSVTSSPKALFARAHLACNLCRRLSISSFKKKSKKKKAQLSSPAAFIR